MIVDNVSIFFTAMGLYRLAVLSSTSAEKEGTAIYNRYAVTGVTGMVFFGTGVVCSVLGLFGAMKYKGWMVIVAAVWHCVNAVLSLLGGDISSTVINGCFAYPHLVFYQQMKKGNLTAENHTNEIQSCCCV
jgi:hypothetical protein